jgi:enamine deaminase RidA (YjgF/YER057c/UK114 family)
MIALALPCLLTMGTAAPGAPGLRYVGRDRTSEASLAVVVDNLPLAHTTQLLPLDAAGKLIGKDQPAAQIEQVLANLQAVLAEAKSGLDRVVKLNVYLARPEVRAEFQQALRKHFAEDARPAVSYVAGTLPHAEALMALDAVAVSGLEGLDGVKLVRSAKVYRTDAAHAAVMPPGARVYVAGQAEKGADLTEATRKTMESLRATLKHLGLQDAQIVQLKSFLKPMTGAGEVTKEMARTLGEQPLPALAFVEWTMALPIEIELVAWAGKDRPGEPVEYITPPGMKASPIYSRVARINHGPTIYVSGLYGLKADSAEDEIVAILAALRQILESTGSDLRHMAKATYYVSTADASRKLNEIRPKYYDPRRPPSASKAEVPGVGMAGRSVTLDMIAVPVPKKP